MTTDAHQVERWDAWSSGIGVTRLFGLADDLERAYRQLAATTAALANWRGQAAERALARIRAATLHVSSLAGLVRRAADAVRSGVPGVAEAARLAIAPPQSPTEAADAAAVAASVDARIATGLATAACAVATAATAPEPALPATNATPAEVAHWWIALPPHLRRWLMVRQAGALGRLAGLPVDVRDEANRRQLTSLLATLRTERDQLAGTLPTIPLQLARAALVRSMLRIAESVERTLATHAGRAARLLTLDLAGAGRVAIGLGDVDRAQNIAVVVPGMGEDAGHGVPGTVAQAADLLAEARRQSVQSTAIVAWVGYAAPGWLQVPFPARARAGGQLLAADMATLAAARISEAAHVTLVGHSYGSTVVGAAVQDGPRRADDLVLLGSPGVLADRVGQLGLSGGHVYVGEAALDPIADTGVFGADPGDRGFDATRIRVDAAPARSWPDRVLAAHSQYFDPDSESLRNIARVVVGRGSDVTRPGTTS
jgi:pimeloyl-ACP methyl ester carboxylesterase